jgi:hypothetical protein
LTGSVWSNLIVWGHDGDHYAYNLENLIYCNFNNIQGFGGGLLKLHGNSANNWHYGNSTFNSPYGQVIAGGTAHGYSLSANAADTLNLITFIRPQIIINTNVTYGPGGNEPTAAQKMFALSTNVSSLRIVAPNFEQNAGSPGSPFEWNALNNSVIDYMGGPPKTYIGGPNYPGDTNVLESGHIIKTGNFSTSSTTGTINFPTPFPNGCKTVVFTSLGTNYCNLTTDPTATGFSYSQPDTGGTTIWYLAYGY